MDSSLKEKSDTESGIDATGGEEQRGSVDEDVVAPETKKHKGKNSGLMGMYSSSWTEYRTSRKRKLSDCSICSKQRKLNDQDETNNVAGPSKQRVREDDPAAAFCPCRHQRLRVANAHFSSSDSEESFATSDSSSSDAASAVPETEVGFSFQRTLRIREKTTKRGKRFHPFSRPKPGL